MDFSTTPLLATWLETAWDRLPWILLGSGVAVLWLSLLVLMLSRWGQARPLSKCAALSVLVHVLLLGYLVVRSGFLPKVLGILLVLASVSYLVDALALLFMDSYGETPIYLALFITIAEIIFPLWLLIKGVAVDRWNERAAAPVGEQHVRVLRDRDRAGEARQVVSHGRPLLELGRAGSGSTRRTRLRSTPWSRPADAPGCTRRRRPGTRVASSAPAGSRR